MKIVPVICCLMALIAVQAGVAISLPVITLIGPVQASFVRFSFAAAIAVGASAAFRPRSLTQTALLPSLFMGVAMAGMGIFFSSAVTRMPLALATAIEFLGPLGIAVATSRSLFTVLIALLAFAGICFTLAVGSADISLYAALPAIGAAASWAAYILVAKKVGQASSSAGSLGIALAVAAVLSCVTSLAEGTFQLPSVSVLGRLLVAACFYPLIPYALEMRALKTMLHYQFGILMSVEPLVAVAIGWSILGQGISRWQIMGLAMITFSNALSVSHRGVVASLPETTR
ncbi:EamA family transporter [Paraburkholderia sp. SIMBA_030]|uniref:EamA family transporter n=1 Tax=Paraburkholderia sp. SIMBA_030 TaxID=3085773 RepID=UPI0039784C74